MKRGGAEFYALAPDVVLERLRTTRQGLDADAAAQRLADDGPNYLDLRQRGLVLELVTTQLKDPIVVLLLASSLIALLLGDVIVGGTLAAITLLNCTLGFLEQYRASRQIRSLKHLVVLTTTILRNGVTQTVDTNTLVLGDIVYLTPGEPIPADLRIIHEEALVLHAAAVTGESATVHAFSRKLNKKTVLAKRHNMAYLSGSVFSGTGYGVVVATGNDTELGTIIDLSSKQPLPESKTTRELRIVARRVTFFALALSLGVLVFGLLTSTAWTELFFLIVALVAAVVPQGLPTLMTANLADSANQLSKQGLLVRDPWIITSLGATTLICTDKTGTLTTGAMSAQKITVGKTTYHITGLGYEPKGTFVDAMGKPIAKTILRDLELPLTAAVLCNNATIGAPDASHAQHYPIGSPTEAALLVMAAKAGFQPSKLIKAHPEVRQLAFDTTRKRMSSIRTYDGKQYVFVKGAPESMLSVSREIWDHGHTRTLHSKDKQSFQAAADHSANAGLRTIALAYKVLASGTNVHSLDEAAIESDLIYLGNVTLTDPLRPDIATALAHAQEAGIGIALLSGDSALASTAIAKEAGLAEHSKLRTLTSEAISDLSDAELAALVQNYTVICSRVSSEEKVRIVTAAQNAGYVVTAIGDGINDAPVLKRADVGVAMGISGTDAAKESANIILTNDNLATLVRGIAQSRQILRNLKKATATSFASNVAELAVLLASFLAAVFWDVPFALAVMQILAIDLIGELLPISALGRDKPEHSLMHESTKAYKEPVFSRRATSGFIASGLLIAGLAFSNYVLFFDRHDLPASLAPDDSQLHLQAMTLTYLTLLLCQLANILIQRSDKGLFTRYQLSNHLLWLAIGASLSITAVLMYVPFVGQFFMTTALGLHDVLWALLAAALFIAIRQFQLYDAKHRRAAVHALHKAVTAAPVEQPQHRS